MFRKVLKVNNTYKANLLIHQRSNFNGTLVINNIIHKLWDFLTDYLEIVSKRVRR